MAKKKNKGKYYITQEQYADIDHLIRLLDSFSDDIKNICSGEKDDIVYGFELGKIHNYMRSNYIEMLDLQSDIEDQN